MASPFLTAGAATGDSGGELSSGDDSGEVESLQGPETETSGSLAELFEQAAARLQGLVQVASREQLLYLYARYKQVKVGNCNTPKPSFFDFEGKQKWEAWKALGDSSPSQAMQEYIAVVKKLDPGWNPQSPEKKGKEANTGFGGPVVSSLYHEEIIREEDKNVFDYCRENNIDHVTKVIRSKNVDVNMKDEEGRTLLHWACDRGHKELVTVLLRYKADINCQDDEGQTALHYGSGMCPDFGCLELPPSIRGCDNRNAAACEFLDIVELLLQSGADPTLRDQDGCLPEEVTGCKAVCLVLQQHTTGKA
uniref:acyl-CoA-binding domain-containing protein 6 isoform X4 n=1 Tax=Nyctereutes procyonoides TaxID=34880 RepID=UPI002443CAC4|nr:acyl-CoA-binding domain-containing protein 6 isoform X4 [Nyctereutes procyonoides]